MNFPLEKFEGLQTPFYFYDLSLLQSTLQALQAELAPRPHFHVHYAVKANAESHILSFIAQAGLGADCVSGGEIRAALAAGFSGGDIVFAGVGKNDAEIRLALEADIHSFNVESLPELEVINQIAGSLGKKAKVAFRVNPNVDAHTHEKITTGLPENKFGIAPEDLLAAVERATRLPHIEFVGMHFHIGSQIVEFTPFELLCERINEFQDLLEHAGFVSRSINVGGGLGIDYENPEANPIPDFKTYFQTFTSRLKLRAGQQLHFELGRSVVAQCGSLISRVLYIKEGRERNFAIVDAGFTDLVRPAMYGSHHFTQNLSAPPASPLKKYDIVGPICESSDVFSKDEVLPESRRGHFIAFRSAGAYGQIMASSYNCRPLPKAYFSEL